MSDDANNPPPETRLQQLAQRRNATLARIGLAMGAGFMAMAAVLSGYPWLVIPSVLAMLASALIGSRSLTRGLVLMPGPQGSVGGEIGMGADVHPSALVEPGARVEMGASVQGGAVVRAGAVIGMGSSVQSNAEIGPDAIVGWGATVQAGAIVGRGAAIGSGATVRANARVLAHTRIGAGASFAGGAAEHSSVERRELSAPGTPAQDERDARIDALADRVDRELAGTTDGVDAFLGNPRDTIQVVRRTCHDLLRRERALRKLLDPAEHERIGRELAALQSRLAAEGDAITRQRLQGALEAIEERRRQQELVLTDANRLEAEHTRLVWTLEGLLAHAIRLRTTQSGAAAPELGRGLAQLRDEVGAMANAMEHVQALDVEPPPPSEAIAPRSRERG